jgi:hypothetical protein
VPGARPYVAKRLEVERAKHVEPTEPEEQPAS